MFLLGDKVDLRKCGSFSASCTRVHKSRFTIDLMRKPEKHISAKGVTTTQRILRKQGELLAIHAFWDRQAVAIAHDHGIDLPQPPPLYTTPS